MFTDFIMFLQQIKSRYRCSLFDIGIINTSSLYLFVFVSLFCFCDCLEECVGSKCTKKEVVGQPQKSGVGAHLSYALSQNRDFSVQNENSSSIGNDRIAHHCRGGRTKLTSLQGYIIDGPGNYSIDIRCTWLIESGQRGLPIKLSFNHIATECAWDHIYVYDGDSAFSPVVAALSGLVQKPGYERNRHEVITHSGSTYIAFYSDAAFYMSGFNITYKVNSSCSVNCTEHGQCINSECRCEPGWYGPDCTYSLCPAGCNTGSCDPVKHRCLCPHGFHGSDCGTPIGRSVWSRVSVQSLDAMGVSSNRGVASHAGVTYHDYIYYFGGFRWEGFVDMPVLRFSVLTEQFEELQIEGAVPSARYGHSAVLYKDTVLVYGGSTANHTSSDQLWSFDLIGQSWQKLTNQGSPIDVTGHSAHVINGTMYVVFGYSPVYGYVGFIQKYDIANQRWSLARSRGAIVSGAYGAASVYDVRTLTIYVHAGYRLTLSGGKSDDLYSYHIPSGKWRVLSSTGKVRYLHSAALVDGLILVFGGNTDNDVHFSTGARCYSHQIMAYDTLCDRWLSFEEPTSLGYTARYGHTAILHNQTMYVFGGFHGQLLFDPIKYSPGVCQVHSDRSACLSANQGRICVWTNQTCLPLSVGVANDDVISPTCPSRVGGKMFGHLSMECARLRTCSSCLTSSAGCSWCDSGCLHGTCPPHTQATIRGECIPMLVARDECHHRIKCDSCHLLNFCLWNPDKNICQYTGGDRESFTKRHNLTVHCPVVCSTRTSCFDCTNNGCMWCSAQRRCADSDAYLASFPYGQCPDWTTRSFKCPASECPSIEECGTCLRHPLCGWCDHGSGTGVGKCLYGANSGPVDLTTRAVDGAQCPSKQWFFTQCPLCQCNGHSRCREGTDRCIQCQGHTDGETCQYCQRGYWGSALNGGQCAVCDCNEHAETCDQLTGKCQCLTRGIIGRKCDRCDVSRNYHGDPNTNTCYYTLATDFEIIFNMSTPDERHVTRANFMNIPPSHDRDMDFSINCSKYALLNLTVKTNDSPDEFPLITEQRCFHFHERFSHSKFSFGSKKNTTFFVYLYDFETPIHVRVTFTQYLKIDLFNFFITFFGCFLSLLLVAALFWKVKQRYDMYTRRQRVLIEMEKMIKRPFANVLVKLGDLAGMPAPSVRQGHSSQKVPGPSHPSVVSVEPLRDSRLAVVSVLMEMPLGGGYYPPSNQAGLAVASSLVSIGHIKPISDKNPDLHKRKVTQPTLDRRLWTDT